MISERTIHTLELHKVQAMLRSFAVSDMGKAAVDALSPAASLPEADSRVAEDTPVQLTIYRHPASARKAEMKVVLPESDQQMKIRISIRAEQSNVTVDTRSYTVEPEDPRLITEMIDLPDFRNFTMTQREMTCETENLEAGSYLFEFFSMPAELGYAEHQVIVEVTIAE